VYLLLRHAEVSLNQNLSLTLWKWMECRRLCDVPWLLFMLTDVIHSIECKKFTYKITLSTSQILCVWVCVGYLLFGLPSLICRNSVPSRSHLRSSLVWLWHYVFSYVNEMCTVMCLREPLQIWRSCLRVSCFLHRLWCFWNLPFSQNLVKISLTRET
jgi:hypothetical protein